MRKIYELIDIWSRNIESAPMHYNIRILYSNRRLKDRNVLDLKIAFKMATIPSFRTQREGDEF